jgi:hypothetical protein
MPRRGCPNNIREVRELDSPYGAHCVVLYAFSYIPRAPMGHYNIPKYPAGRCYLSSVTFPLWLTFWPSLKVASII